MRSLLVALWLLGSLLSTAANAELSAAEIQQLLIEQSLASYRGNCPCPYFVDRAGRRCGARSAYSKSGGETPLCYAKDVTDEMIARYQRERSKT